MEGNNSVNQPDTCSSQRLDHEPKSTHGGTHGSYCVCGSGWPCCISVGEAALGLVGVQGPNVGECQGRKEGMGRCIEENNGFTLVLA